MKTVLTIKNASYRIPFGNLVIDGLNLELQEGHFLGVLGHNGAGKTTLIDLIMGFRNVTGGVINVFGENPHSLSAELHKEKISFLSQEVALKGDISIENFLQFHSCFYPDYSKEEEGDLLAAFKLNPGQLIGTLSTGQQKKIQIIAGLSTRPSLIIVDEITAVLDAETRFLFFQKLRDAVKLKNASVILATNIAEDLIESADSVLFLSQGKAEVHPPNKILQLFNVRKSA